MDELEQRLRVAADVLTDARDVTLLAHVKPDADTFGSAVALGLALRGRGATVRVSFADPADGVPETLRCLDSSGLAVLPDELPETPEVLVVLDTGSLGRLGSLAGQVHATRAAGRPVVVLDHHASNPGYGTHNVVDENAEATAVLVLALLDELGVQLDEPIARGLYAGLMTDTSSFRRATPATHAMAGRLLEAGVNPDELGRQLVDNLPFSWLGELATVLGTARYEPAVLDGLGLVHAVVPIEITARARMDDVETVVDLLRATNEAEVAVVLKEMRAGEFTVSLRAKSRVDVRSAAQSLGGGGHRLAAGCTLTGTAESVLDDLRTALAAAERL
ncbi:DHH family phosphoesterase [Tamaricihabitans halophyticus]|uniref:DHH family phosphoesterase n=1 Tax=Tamaricihabitans halophyticus TaxID=1262583 RepID=UPI001FB1C165|nr:bifunctional oligoribonuclease/PAP phosphatase NrnA [Tamaricihabitans halophyticus]